MLLVRFTIEGSADPFVSFLCVLDTLPGVGELVNLPEHHITGQVTAVEHVLHNTARHQPPHEGPDIVDGAHIPKAQQNVKVTLRRIIRHNLEALA